MPDLEDTKQGRVRFDRRITLGNILTAVGMLVAIIGGIICATHAYDSITAQLDRLVERTSNLQGDISTIRWMLDRDRTRVDLETK